MARVQEDSQARNAAAESDLENHGKTFSIYVGDLERNVTESQLYDTFRQMGQVVSVRVVKPKSSNPSSLAHGFVNYSNPKDAARAMEDLNSTPLNGKPIRVMYGHSGPTNLRISGGKIFIKNLDKGVDQKELLDIFSAFGNILSCKVITDFAGQCKGYGFVQFDNEESVQKAIQEVDGMVLNDKEVYVGPFLSREERDANVDKTKFTNVFVKNLAETTTAEDLRRIFGERGLISSVVVMMDAHGKSRCFGFVNFENADDAAKSVEALNGYKFQEKEWYVGRAQKKCERESELQQKYELWQQGTNLYVKNLDGSVDEDGLKELFAPFGSITSSKVLKDFNGISKGVGFVAFSTREESSTAQAEMNGKMFISNPLYVAFAQPKEERREMMQAHFSQMSLAVPPFTSPARPMYPPGPGLSQHVFCGRGPPAMIHEPCFGYQQQLVSGMRPGGARGMTEVPMPLNGEAIQLQQNQNPFPLMQHQMLHRGCGFQHGQGRGMAQVQMPGIGRSYITFPYEKGGAPLHYPPRSQQSPIKALATELANASPELQRTMLGNILYPLVEQLYPDMADKVTGMLLELDRIEVLHLLESSEALKATVEEALDILTH